MNQKENRETDIERFIKAFDPAKFKVLKTGIEIRGVRDLQYHMEAAKDLIHRLKLKLTVRHSAEMTIYGGFEVVPG